MPNPDYQPKKVEGIVDRISVAHGNDVHLLMLVGDSTVYKSRKGQPLDEADVVALRLTKSGDAVSIRMLPGEDPAFFEFSNDTIG